MTASQKIEETTMTASFPASRLGHFERKLKQINSRAKRLKVQPVHAVVGEPYAGKWEIIVEGAFGAACAKQVDCQMITVHLTCLESIKLEGDHKLLAVLENVDGHPFITSLVEGRDFSEFRKHTFTRCDHCNTKRFRSKAVIIKSNGKEMVIGTSCLVNYLGYDPSNILNAVSYLQDIRDFGDDEGLMGKMCGSYFGATIEKVVEANITALASNDWHYEKGEEDEPTSMVAQKILRENIKFDEKSHGSFRDRVIAQFQSLAEDLKNDVALNDFTYKVAVLAKIGVVEGKHMKIISGAIASYMRKIRENDDKENRGDSEHFGSVGDKVELEVEISKVSTFSAQGYGYGAPSVTKMIVTGYVNGKDLFTWFTTPSVVVKKGLVIEKDGYTPVSGTHRIKGTVKQHKNDQYGIVTVLTRVTNAK